MHKAIILGCGAATGVPAMMNEWGSCNKNNPKNRRTRAGIYVEFDKAKILIDTSADLRQQYLQNNLRELDGVLYTHAHADHIMGIDDLRSVTQYMNHYLNIYADTDTIDELVKRFGYVFITQKSNQLTHRPHLFPNIVKPLKSFFISDVEITPFTLTGHTVNTTGYCFNTGELVVMSDFKSVPEETLLFLSKINVNVLIIPLTLLRNGKYHAGMDIVLGYIQKIKPEKVILTHMGVECDYDNVNAITPDNCFAGYDGMIVDLEKK